MNKNICYFIPSIIGDDNYCRAFRRDIAHLFQVELVELPGLASDSSALLNMNRICSIVAQNIFNDGHNELYICGYSFGGCIAFEVSKILEKQGIVVKDTIIIDAPSASMTFELQVQYNGLEIPKRKITKRAIVFAIRCILQIAWFRRIYSQAIGLLKNKRRIKFTRMEVKILREKERRKTWQPSQFTGTGIVFLTSQFAPETEKFWQRLCENMSFRHLNARHLAVIRPSMSKFLVEQIECHVLYQQ